MVIVSFICRVLSYVLSHTQQDITDVGAHTPYVCINMSNLYVRT